MGSRAPALLNECVRVSISRASAMLPRSMKTAKSAYVYELEGADEGAVVGRRGGAFVITALEETETGVDTVAQPIASTNPEKFIPVDRSDIVQRVLDKCFEPDQKELAE